MAAVNLYLIWDYFSHMGIHCIGNVAIPPSLNFGPQKVLNTLLLLETHPLCEIFKHALSYHGFLEISDGQCYSCKIQNTDSTLYV